MGDKDKTQKIDLPEFRLELDPKLVRRQERGLCLYPSRDLECKHNYKCVNIKEYADSEDPDEIAKHELRIKKLKSLNQVINEQYNCQ